MAELLDSLKMGVGHQRSYHEVRGLDLSAPLPDLQGEGMGSIGEFNHQ